MGLLTDRLEGIRELMWSSHAASVKMPSDCIGSDREFFVHAFLEGCMPPVCRFGSGMVVDENNIKTGQLDIVIENPFLPSIPLHAAGTNRMYMAEGVAAVVEVKSNFYNKVAEADGVAKTLGGLKRYDIGGAGIHFPSTRINCMGVGYEGYKNIESLTECLNKTALGAILILEPPGVFVSKTFERNGDTSFEGRSGTGGLALWHALCYLSASAGCSAIPSFEPSDYKNP